MSRVSVIIPIYNLKEYLSYSIESALKQSHANIEILLVDDGSTDGSAALCDKYADKYPNIRVIHKPNAGVSAARNIGLEQARGDFIMFLDGDDIIAPHAVETLLQDFEKSQRCLYAGFSYQRISDYQTAFLMVPGERKEYDDTAILRGLMDFSYENIGVWGKIFPANMIRKYRFVEGKGANEDKFFLIEYLMDKHGTISERDDRLYGYFVRPGSATQSAFSHKLLDMIYFSGRILSEIRQSRPELTECAEYNDAVTRLSVLKSIVRSRAYRKERQLFQQIKADLKHDYKEKKLSFYGRYKTEIVMLRISDLLYILCVYLYDRLKKGRG